MSSEAKANKLVDGLLGFLSQSPTPFHAVKSLSTMLGQNGFQCLKETESWQLTPGARYYVVRGGSSIVAFVLGKKPVAETGLRIIGAHTDSPCLKVKPTPDLYRKGFWQLGIEVYGGALLNPWFDRDLSLAGQVTYVNKQGELCSRLLDFHDPIACVPNLAIHLDREANNNRTVNPQTDMNAIIGLTDSKRSFRELLLDKVADKNAREVLDFNLSFYDTQAPVRVGLQREFIASARLDNLASCFLGAQALFSASDSHTSILVCNDHEEVGSRSAVGAQGPMLADIIDRIAGDNIGIRQQAMRRSLMLSVDNAHAVHPNYAAKHDDEHGPLINKGPVVKFDANQGYATGSGSASLVRWLAKGSGGASSVPLQNYVTRADMRCGSTIGPLTASAIGVTTVDLGLPTFAMHSIRELAGVADISYMESVLSRFVVQEELPVIDTL